METREELKHRQKKRRSNQVSREEEAAVKPDLLNVATDSGEGLLVLGVAIHCHLTLNFATCKSNRSCPLLTALQEVVEHN